MQLPKASHQTVAVHAYISLIQPVLRVFFEQPREHGKPCFPRDTNELLDALALSDQLRKLEHLFTRQAPRECVAGHRAFMEGDDLRA